MRLIDADKLMLSLADWELQEAPIITYPKPKEFTADDMQRMIWRTIRDCGSAVEEQPTVEAIPVEWLKQKANDLAFAYWHGVKNKLTLPMKDLPLVIETMVQYWEKENE